MRNSILCTGFTVLLIGAGMFVPPRASAQIISEGQMRQAAVSNREMMNLDLRAQRSEIVAANMALTPAQAEVFLPIYLDFDSELQNLWNERLKLVARYAAEFQTLTDGQADALMTDMLELDDQLLKIRKKYYREFKAALGAKLAARFFQIDRRLNSLLELQAAQSIPLVQ